MKINDYGQLVMNVIFKESEKDNWGWYIVDEDENDIVFNWGYFDYIEENDRVHITIEQYQDDIVVKTYMPIEGTQEIAIVGNDFWCDCKTVEKGIEIAIKEIIHTLKDIY